MNLRPRDISNLARLLRVLQAHEVCCIDSAEPVKHELDRAAVAKARRTWREADSLLVRLTGKPNRRRL